MPDETLKIKQIQELNKSIDKILYEIELEFVHEKEQFYLDYSATRETY